MIYFIGKMSSNNIPPIQIGEHRVFGFQGGMGVGISQSGLASAVAEEGWAGIIASVGLGALNGNFAEQVRLNRGKIERVSGEERKAIFDKLYALANSIALKEEIRKARGKTNGVIGVNIMHALSDYSSLVRAAIEEKTDLIISGAGIPRDLPSYLNGVKTKLIPIVSSARLAEMICKSWGRQGHLPDAIVVEGPMAGGHLGYSKQELDNPEFVAHGLERIVGEVIPAVKQYGDIPIIVGGGLFYGGDIRKLVKLGAAGAQIATRLVPTHECDASPQFKQAYLDCNKEDLRLISSPVGMPGRAIVSEFLTRTDAGEKIPVACPYHCLKTCVPEKSPYCIANALTEAYKGNLEKGFVFAGSNAWRCDHLASVKKVLGEIDQEYASKKECN